MEKLKIEVMTLENPYSMKLEKEYDFTPQLTNAYTGEKLTETDCAKIGRAVYREAKKLAWLFPEKRFFAVGYPNQAGHFAPILSSGSVHF